MKRLRYQSILPVYVIVFVLLVGTLMAGFGIFLYNITIQKPDGQTAISKWPIDFTQSFSRYFFFEEDKPKVKQAGLTLLQENNLWLQVIDTNGDEVLSFDKPQEISTHHSPFELLDLYQNGAGQDSAFIGSVQSGSKDWTYIIGFPIHITKVTTYVNGDRYATLKPIAIILLCVFFFMLLIIGFVYSFIITKQLERVRKAFKEVSARNYTPAVHNGYFSDVYEALNILNAEIKASDEEKAKNDKLREEWIANITHDLKTPLSPIRGYAELIADTERVIMPNEINKYGSIILKNTAYAEELINDLKLTYQLQNDMLPLHKRRQNIVRFVKELIIDLLNHPEYEARNISFYSVNETIELEFDGALLKRALNNLLTNALIHNCSDTEVYVFVKAEEDIQVSIQDNGRGMTQAELDNLFVRYYRGDNTNAKPEGSGLGMAIAKQIIELHGGRILAESKLGSGSCFSIHFPTLN